MHIYIYTHKGCPKDAPVCPHSGGLRAQGGRQAARILTVCMCIYIYIYVYIYIYRERER